MIVATSAGEISNLELTLPIVGIVFLIVWLWDDMERWLGARLDEANELLDEPTDGPPLLRAVPDPRPNGVVERRPEDRERAMRERIAARQSYPRTRGMRR